MPLVGLVHLLMAAFFGVHAIRSGQPVYWLFILFAFPLLGSIVYFFAIYLPSARYTPGGMRAARAVQALVDPNRELRDAETEFDRTPTAYNRARLGAALLAKGRVDEAIEHHAQAASGPYANDAAFLRGLAMSQLAGERYADAASTLGRLFNAHPDQRTGALAIAYAEALSGAGSTEAPAAFESLIAQHPTIEAQCKYGLFLLKSGQTGAARRAFDTVLRDAARGHRHSRELNREWIACASAEIKRMDA